MCVCHVCEYDFRYYARKEGLALMDSSAPRGVSTLYTTRGRARLSFLNGI